MARTPRAGAVERDILGCLLALLDHMRSHMLALTEAFDLFPPYAMALWQLDGPTPMKLLAARMRCDASFVTAIADVLEKRGLAKREVDPGDRRNKNLVLTAKGHRLQARLDRDLTAGLPGIRQLDATARRQLLGLLRSMVEAEDVARSGQ